MRSKSGPIPARRGRADRRPLTAAAAVGAPTRAPPDRPRRMRSKSSLGRPIPAVAVKMQSAGRADRADGAQADAERPTADLASSPGGPGSRSWSRGARSPNRHRAGARNPHRRRPPQRSAGQSRGSAETPHRHRRGSAKPARNNAHHLTGCEPTHRQPRRIAPTWSAGLRPASRGSAKPAAMTPSPASVSATPPFSCGRGERADPIMWVSPGGGRHRYPKRSETASCWTPGCFRRKNPVPRPRRAVVRPA